MSERLSESARPVGEKDEPGKFLQRQRLVGDSRSDRASPRCNHSDSETSAIENRYLTEKMDKLHEETIVLGRFI